MDASYILPFIESTKSVFSTMLQLSVSCGQPVAESAIPASDSDVSGIIGMSGDVLGSVILSFPMDTAREVVAKFVGMEVGTDSEDFPDAVGEILNMISGGAKAKFEGKTVSISCPSVVVGAGHKVQQMSDAICIKIPCNCPCGTFAVEVCMKEADAESAESSEISTSAST